MKYLYYYIWISLAFIHSKISKVLFVLNKQIFKIRRTSESEQKKWKDNYNESFLDFPGGMIDWAAFGLFLLLFFSIVLIFLVSFDLEAEIFKSKIHLVILFVTLMGFIYYVIYFRSIIWLKKRIRSINKKFYL